MSEFSGVRAATWTISQVSMRLTAEIAVQPRGPQKTLGVARGRSVSSAVKRIEANIAGMATHALLPINRFAKRTQ